MILVSYLAKLIFVFYTSNMWSILLKHVIRLTSPTQSLVFMSKGHVTRNLQIKSYIITFLTKIDKMVRL